MKDEIKFRNSCGRAIARKKIKDARARVFPARLLRASPGVNTIFRDFARSRWTARRLFVTDRYRCLSSRGVRGYGTVITPGGKASYIPRRS